MKTELVCDFCWQKLPADCVKTLCACMQELKEHFLFDYLMMCCETLLDTLMVT